MSRVEYHRKPESLVRAQRESGARDIANEYMQSQDGPDLSLQHTVHRLQKRGTYGYLLAGELIVEQATKDPQDMVSSRLIHARTILDGAKSPNSDENPLDTLANNIKARMRIAQLPSLKTIFAKQELPASNYAKDMYTKLVRIGRDTTDAVKRNQNDRSKSAIELRGLVGEFAVLLLGQRFAIRELGSDGWLPMQSFFSEDHGGNCRKDTGEAAWDVNIFTRLGDDQIKKTYKLQVKASEKGSQKESRGPLTVNVNPDLALQSDGKSYLHLVGDRIIRSCIAELESPDTCAVLTKELDKRAELLLDLIDQS